MFEDILCLFSFRCTCVFSQELCFSLKKEYSPLAIKWNSIFKVWLRKSFNFFPFYRISIFGQIWRSDSKCFSKTFHFRLCRLFAALNRLTWPKVVQIWKFKDSKYWNHENVIFEMKGDESQRGSGMAFLQRANTRQVSVWCRWIRIWQI